MATTIVMINSADCELGVDDCELASAVLNGHTTGVLAIAFSHDSTMVATGGHDAHGKLWAITDPAQPALKATIPLATINALAFKPAGGVLATASDDGKVRLWNISSPVPSVLSTIDAHPSAALKVAFSPSGKLLATAGKDGSAALWNVENASTPYSYSARLRPERMSDDIQSVMFTAEETLTTGTSGGALVWNVPLTPVPPAIPTIRSIVRPQDIHPRPMYTAAMSPDGRCVIVAGSNGLHLMDSQLQSQEIQTYGSQADGKGAHRDISFSPSGKFALAASAHNEGQLINITNLVAPRRTNYLSGHLGTVIAVAISPDGKLLATASADHTAMIWRKA